MTYKQHVLFLMVQAPIAVLIGILCALAYSLEIEETVSVDWMIVLVVSAAILGIGVVRSLREELRSRRTDRS